MTTIRSYNKRLEALKSERSTFIPVWRELSDYHLAHRGRFLTADRNKGHKRDTKQFNNTSRMALRTLASGMMAGITSPARPWFRLSTGHTNDDPAVAEWLHIVQKTIYSVFSRSNLYNVLHTTYAELGCFGTAALGIFEDFDDVIRGKSFTIGSYLLAMNGKDEVDTFYREYELTVGQCVKAFGIENVSRDVARRWETGNTESWVKLVHVVEPNDDRDSNSPLATDMKFRSVYYEYGNQTSKDNKFLRKSGFDDFPILAPRWDVVGEDVYAIDCPGLMALGDTKALQLGERRKFQAIDKLVDPPLQGSATLRAGKTGDSLRAGDILWLNSVEKGLSSIYDFRPDLNAIMSVNQESENRVQRAFYEDLFLMLANSDRRQITAREVAEKHEEKLLMLGPVLERLHNELLDPLIDRTFNILMRGEVLPPPPESLVGADLKVEYVSVLAQAQQLVSVGGIERIAGFVGELANVWPEARFKFDPMQAVDDYAEAVGGNPKLLRTSREASQMLQGEQQAAQQEQATQQAAQQAQTMQTMAGTEVDGDTALNKLLQESGVA